MILPDVNVLVYAHREDAVEHPRYRQWLEEILQGGQPYAISDHVLSGFLRVVTHPRVFTTPSPIQDALDFARQVREQPNCRIVAPGRARIAAAARARWAKIRASKAENNAVK